jgi:hypothetical protein
VEIFVATVVVTLFIINLNLEIFAETQSNKQHVHSPLLKTPLRK